jgi:hypothetical protein
LTTNLPTTEPDGEWTTIRAEDLAVGNEVAGDMLPLGQPGEIIFRRVFERNRSEWVFVAFVQWDGFHDSTTFLAHAPVRARFLPAPRVADPTGLAYSRPADGDEPQPVAGREPMHTGGLTEQGLVDETAAEPPIHYAPSRGGALSACDLDLAELANGELWSEKGGRVTCRACLDAMPQVG